MKENICTIPINDIFMLKDGCPVCNMYSMLEKQYVEYVTGSAMMESSVRIETNKKGFCHNHFEMMVNSDNRLSNALILETHLEEIIKNYNFSLNRRNVDKKTIKDIDILNNSCFVCDKVLNDIDHFFATVFVEWQKSPKFKELYKEQPYICLNHYSLIMDTASGKRGISRKNMKDFYSDTTKLTYNYLKNLKDDITHFASMFDYRSQGKSWGNSKDAIERSVEFLTSKKVFKKLNNKEEKE